MTQFIRDLPDIRVIDTTITLGGFTASGSRRKAQSAAAKTLIRRSCKESTGGLPGHYNDRFGKEPHDPKDLYRPLSTGDDLADVFGWREKRTVSNSLTLQYDKVLLEPNEITRALRRSCGKAFDIGRGGYGICDRYQVINLEALNTS